MTAIPISRQNNALALTLTADQPCVKNMTNRNKLEKAKDLIWFVLIENLYSATISEIDCCIIIVS